MPKRMALDIEQMTPFGRRVYDYMLSCRPNKLVRDLAEETGISDQTIWDWLRKGTIPRRATIVQLAERVPELASLDELLAAAGLPSTAATRQERAANADMLRDSLAELLAMVDADPTFGPDERAIIHRAMEHKVEEFIHQTDTWREYSHTSPAMHEAQVAADRARLRPARPTQPPKRHERDGYDAERDSEQDNQPSGPQRRVTGV